MQNKQTLRGESRTRPKVSILLPVRNEAKHIRQILNRLVKQTWVNDLEVIVVDGESEDATRDIVAEFQKSAPCPIQLLSNPKRTPYAGLNLGIRAAKGDYIVRVDGRSICPPDYIEKCVKTLEQTKASNVGGVQKQFGNTPTQLAVAIASCHPFGIGNAQFRLGKRSGFVDTAYLGCFPRELFEKVGFFDEDGPVISEDSAMNQRIRDAGGKVYLNADIVVEYPAKETFKDFWRQYFIYGGARAHVVLKYKKFTSPRQLVPLLLIGAIVLAPLLAFIHPAFWYVEALLVGGYITANLAVSTWLGIARRQISLIPRLFVAFACLHFAWPLGFVVRMLEGSQPGAHWRRAKSAPPRTS